MAGLQQEARTVSGPLQSETSLARRLGVARSTVHLWRHVGLITPVATNPIRYAPGTAALILERAKSDHGPECPKSTDPFHAGISCECVACHCGPEHVPGGRWGACARCHRPRWEDLEAS